MKERGAMVRQSNDLSETQTKAFRSDYNAIGLELVTYHSPHQPNYDYCHGVIFS